MVTICNDSGRPVRAVAPEDWRRFAWGRTLYEPILCSLRALLLGAGDTPDYFQWLTQATIEEIVAWAETVRVTVKYSDDSMWGAAQHDGYDLPASYLAFERQLRAAVPWPILFERGIDDGVSVACGTIAERAQADRIKAEAVELLGDVWAAFKWPVAR